MDFGRRSVCSEPSLARGVKGRREKLGSGEKDEKQFIARMREIAHGRADRGDVEERSHLTEVDWTPAGYTVGALVLATMPEAKEDEGQRRSDCLPL